MTESQPSPAPTRVAAYARASVSRGLEYDSVTAQFDAISAYVESQRGSGWILVPERYVDDGYSGGNVARPAFERLMGDVNSGRVDVICVYKLDRLSRSLLDFAQLVDALEKRGVSLVSITQQFSTATSLGKLTLGILMSFAEFERANIAERTRDKVMSTRRRGMWTGGRPPLGYDVVDKALVINKTEAETVRVIFQCYLDNADWSPRSANLNDAESATRLGSLKPGTRFEADSSTSRRCATPSPIRSTSAR